MTAFQVMRLLFYVFVVVGVVKLASADLVIYSNSLFSPNPSQVDIKRLVGTPFGIRFLSPYIKILHSKVVTEVICMPCLISLL